jgi:hypothetical protein
VQVKFKYVVINIIDINYPEASIEDMLKEKIKHGFCTKCKSYGLE